jgi:hypothetical protein
VSIAEQIEAQRRALNRPDPPADHARERYTDAGGWGQLRAGYRRDYPARYAAVAAELAFRDGVRARATAAGVVAIGDVPAWYRRKAELVDVPLRVLDGGEAD